jgi:proteasome lid subunit RPN8/RPN11
MVAHLEEALPMEGCGLLAGENDWIRRLYTIDNSLSSSVAYEMDPLQQLEAMLDLEENGWDLIAIFHSHPNGPRAPSITDITKAYYPEAAHVIVSFQNKNQPEVHAFTIIRGHVEEIPIVIV